MAPIAEPLSDDDRIWYASYGSNCLAERFLAYLTGGRAPGAAYAEAGSRDPSPPIDSAAIWLPTPVRFVGDRAKWGGGGIAFLDHTGAAAAPGRRYLITKGQFDDVAAQESRRPSVPLPVHELTIGTVHPVGSGPYDGLLALPPVGGVPVVTFTTPHPILDRDPNPPSAAYLGTIIRGLCEVHTSPVHEIAAALHASPGVALGWSPADIAALV